MKMLIIIVALMVAQGCASFSPHRHTARSAVSSAAQTDRHEWLRRYYKVRADRTWEARKRVFISKKPL